MPPRQASDGQAALEKLSQAADSQGDEDGVAPIDLVLVDFVMPRMNGFQFCRAVRETARLRTTPIVLMSAKSDRIRDHFVEQTGAMDAITKPFDAQALIAVIENAIKRAEEWRQREEVQSARIAEEIEQAESQAPSIDARAVLMGDLGIIPIGAVLQLLQIESKTGVLVVTDGTTEISMSLREGLIDLVQAHGAGSEFRLGRYVVEHGLATPGDIERILRDNNPTPLPPPFEMRERATIPKEETSTSGRRLLGDLLVDSGRVTREQLRDALARQSSELVYEVVRWPRGRFDFRLDPLPALAVSARLSLPVASVVMEGFAASTSGASSRPPSGASTRSFSPIRRRSTRSGSTAWPSRSSGSSRWSTASERCARSWRRATCRASTRARSSSPCSRLASCAVARREVAAPWLASGLCSSARAVRRASSRRRSPSASQRRPRSRQCPGLLPTSSASPCTRAASYRSYRSGPRAGT